MDHTRHRNLPPSRPRRPPHPRLPGTVITNTRESHWYWFARDLELIDVIATGHADTAAQAIHRADTAITAHHALKRHPHTTPTE